MTKEEITTNNIIATTKDVLLLFIVSFILMFISTFIPFLTNFSFDTIFYDIILVFIYFAPPILTMFGNKIMKNRTNYSEKIKKIIKTIFYLFIYIWVFFSGIVAFTIRSILKD